MGRWSIRLCMKYLKWKMAVCVCGGGGGNCLVMPQTYRTDKSNIFLGKPHSMSQIQLLAHIHHDPRNGFYTFKWLKK